MGVGGGGGGWSWPARSRRRSGRPRRPGPSRRTPRRDGLQQPAHRGTRGDRELAAVTDGSSAIPASSVRSKAPARSRGCRRAGGGRGGGGRRGGGGGRGGGGVGTGGRGGRVWGGEARAAWSAPSRGRGIRLRSTSGSGSRARSMMNRALSTGGANPHGCASATATPFDAGGRGVSRCSQSPRRGASQRPGPASMRSLTASQEHGAVVCSEAWPRHGESSRFSGTSTRRRFRPRHPAP